MENLWRFVGPSHILCWHRWRRLSTPRLWWLWLFTILIHLLLSVSTVAVIVILCLNMQRLLKVLQEQGWPVEAVMVVGDRAMLSADIVLRLTACPTG